jgi:hypothetical protein
MKPQRLCSTQNQPNHKIITPALVGCKAGVIDFQVFAVCPRSLNQIPVAFRSPICCLSRDAAYGSETMMELYLFTGAPPSALLRRFAGKSVGPARLNICRVERVQYFSSLAPLDKRFHGS